MKELVDSHRRGGHSQKIHHLIEVESQPIDTAVKLYLYQFTRQEDPDCPHLVSERDSGSVVG